MIKYLVKGAVCDSVSSKKQRWQAEAEQDCVVVIGISGAVTRKDTDGPVGPETWECMRSQEKKSSIFIFIILIESQTFVPIYLPGWRGWEEDYFWHLPLSLKLLGLWKAILEASKGVTSVGCLS